MQWLSQNWVWIVFAIGIFLLMRRGGMGCGMGSGRHSRGSSHDESRGDAGNTRFRDPVSGEQVTREDSISYAYMGRPYYFASPENRDKFAASPERYAGGGQPVDSRDSHHRHGC